MTSYEASAIFALLCISIILMIIFSFLFRLLCVFCQQRTRRRNALREARTVSLTSLMFDKEKEEVFDPTCPICLENFSIGSKFCKLVCSHSFHKKCLREWLKCSRNCPVCHQDFKRGTNLRRSQETVVKERIDLNNNIKCSKLYTNQIFKMYGQYFSIKIAPKKQLFKNKNKKFNVYDHIQTESEYSVSLSFSKTENNKFIKLPPFLPFSSFESSNNSFYAKNLFQYSSRFGKDVVIDVYDNSIALIKWLNYIPPQNEFDKLFKGILKINDISILNDISDSERKSKKINLGQIYDEIEKKKIKNTYKSFKYRIEYLKKSDKFKSIDGKTCTDFFLLEEPKEKDKKEYFICHPFIYAFIKELAKLRILSKTENIIKIFQEGVRNYIKIPLINIIYANESIDKAKIINYCENLIPKDYDKKRTVFNYDHCPEEKAGFFISSNCFEDINLLMKSNLRNSININE